MNVKDVSKVPTILKDVVSLSEPVLWHHRLGHAPMRKIEKIAALAGKG